jgi:hypothetical protein
MVEKQKDVAAPSAQSATGRQTLDLVTWSAQAEQGGRLGDDLKD